jgi:hypothetical protein
MSHADWNPTATLIPHAAASAAAGEDIGFPSGGARVLRRWSVAELIARAAARAPEPRAA